MSLPESTESDWGEWGELSDDQPVFVERDEATEDGRHLKITLANLHEAEQKNLDHAFAQLDAAYPVPESIAAQKQAAEEKKGEKILWPEWISSPDGASIDEAQQLVDWANERTRRMNEDPAVKERLARSQERFAKGLEVAVTAGKLHPSLLARYQQQPKPVLEIAHIFDPMQYQGMAYNVITDDRDPHNVQRMIVLSRDGHVPHHIFNHEQIHSLGSFEDEDEKTGGVTWNEAAADEIAAEIDEHTSDFADNERAAGYSDEKDALRAAERLARMNTYELSELFAKGTAAQPVDFLEEASKRAHFDLKGAYRHYLAKYTQRAEEAGLDNLDRGDMAYYMARHLTKRAVQLNLPN